MATPRPARRRHAAPHLEALEGRLLLSADSGPAATVWAATKPVSPSSSILLKFAPGTPQSLIQADLDAVNGRIVAQYPNGPNLVALPPTSDRAAALALLGARPEVAYAEANATIRATAIRASAVVVPNDPSFGQQWGLSMIDAPAAWGITTGSSATVVAVLDTGIDFNSPDLVSKLWTNPLVNRDGLRNALHGWNYISNTANVQDDDGHGSHVSGVIAGAANNAVGVAGVNWNAQIMPVKVLDNTGSGTTDAAVSGVYFAVQHGAKVINASWGGDVFSKAMLDALNYANAAGVVFVTAAGNESSNNDVVTTYPASYRMANELVVAAVDSSGNLADFSNYGASTVDLAAPGVSILSTVPGGYATYDGTSMATPFVSGTVALLAGANPSLNAAQLVNVVRATVKPLNNLKGLMVSPGVVDAYFALTNRVGGGTISTSSVGPLAPGASSQETIEATILSDRSTYNSVGGTPQAYVAYLYQTLFGRAATQAEITFHATRLGAGESRIDLVAILQGSTEGLRTRVARWYITDLRSAATLNALKSDPGVAAWANLLASGQSDNAVRAAILSSNNVYSSFGGTPDSYITSLFPVLLGRAADPIGKGFLVSALIQGTSRSDIIRSILATVEGRRARIAQLFQTDFGYPGSIDALKSNPNVIFWANYLGPN